MKIGLIGLSNSGKTTIMNALAKTDAEVTPYANTNTEPNVAIVNVGDERIERLSQMYQPKKTTYATIEILDFIGFSSENADSKFIQTIKRSDALAHVVRNFNDGLLGEPNPLRDVRVIDSELILSDMIIVENRLDRIATNKKRGIKSNDSGLEESILQRIHAHLNENKPISDLPINADEKRIINGFQFLTQKPLFIILNSEEDCFGKNGELIAEIETVHAVIEFAGKFEMELSRLGDPEEINLFMEDIGIEVSARNRLTQFAYDILGYTSFFTVGKDEVRAWTIHKGETAVDAAMAIHSDLARGFIRAECFSYDDLMTVGSEAEVKKNGKYRLEGKDYIVNDGDILSIRFNV
ncbi:redox-regulated ATPase YchF [candidate division KSB1 bacterium]|nr:redox-regulated ATPase YchF [candidate division KSB1 bacterium]